MKRDLGKMPKQINVDGEIQMSQIQDTDKPRDLGALRHLDELSDCVWGCSRSCRGMGVGGGQRLERQRSTSIIFHLQYVDAVSLVALGFNQSAG